MNSTSDPLPLVGMGLKYCVGCRKTKPLSDYYLYADGKPYGRCKPCTCKRQQENKAIRADAELLAERERLRAEASIAVEKTCRICSRVLPLEQFSPISRKPGKRLARCRECMAVQAHAHYLTIDPEKQRARYEASVRDHREERLENARRWKRENPDRVREYKRAWNEANPQPARDRAKRWVEANPEKVREQHRLRKARVRGAGGSFSEADWDRVKAQYDWRCLVCGVQEPEVVLHADHVVPLAMGGWNIASNLQPLCGYHNNKKNAKFIDYRPDPYGLKKGTDNGRRTREIRR